VGKAVSVDELIDGLWGDEPTPGARSTLQTYVSNLRHELGDVIVHDGGGYRLDVDPQQVDAVRFEEEVARAGALVESNPAEASQRLRAALALWRGHPYADAAGSFRLELEATRLEELRLGAVEARIGAELALGHHAELVPELEVLCTEFPLREGFRAQHMLALYRSGRQAEALRAFQKTRTYLAEEVGLDPSVRLRDLERLILNQDASLLLEIQPQVQTLAFLLTDIEDSTVLWEMQTEAMRSAVAEHDRIVFEAVERSGGRIVKRVGDGIDTAFGDIGAAVRAAEEIERGLAGADWGETGPLLVRAAIDLGEVEARDGDYFGPVLNRAGRLLAAGHGGQVLLSADAQAKLAATESGWQAKALGEFRFKGIGSPQNVFQLVLDGLPAEFPPLRVDRLPPLVPAVAFGRSLRGYELREQVGSGDFGIVYRAYQPAIGREVAIKVIRPELINQPSFVRGFEAEAQLVAQLEHPHIVSLYDYWRDPEGAYLVMRWLRGGSLRWALERGPWNLEPAARLLSQVGSALSYAHRQGVVHGDLKPANVLLDDEGHAYLSDFGIASRLAGTTELPRVVASSPAYVPPEVLEGTSRSARSDLYCLGLLTFELLAGRRPPMDGALPSLAEIRPELPDGLDGVIAYATAADPAEPYESVDAFLAAFQRALGAATPTPEIAYTPADNPYKGLRAFGEADAEDFYGRDSLVAELVAAVGEHRLVAVVGPSGIGKSSVVKAGLIPALRGGALPGSGSWVISDLFPGSYPFEELAAALLRVAVERPDDLVEELARDELGMRRVAKRILPPETEAVLVVDQFEELFTLDDRGGRAAGVSRRAGPAHSRRPVTSASGRHAPR
jgi:class 3 adenylate cyclase